MCKCGFAVAILLGIAPMFGGCGTFVPEIQENRADKVAGQQLVQSIVYNITCEVQDAIDKIYNNRDHRREHTFLDSWGVQIALSLQVEEKSSVNPVNVAASPDAVVIAFEVRNTP